MPLKQARNSGSTAGPRVLRVDASGRLDGSVSRGLAAEFVAALEAQVGQVDIVERDLASSPPRLIDETWIGATFTPAGERDATGQEALRESDVLVSELTEADILLIATPVYNFGIPAALKAWVDLIARAQLTFRYTENGPQGLLQRKRAVVIVATGGTQVGSDVDFATPYLRHILSFVGITDVSIIAADRLLERGEEAVETARRAIARLVRGQTDEEKAA